MFFCNDQDQTIKEENRQECLNELEKRIELMEDELEKKQNHENEKDSIGGFGNY